MTATLEQMNFRLRNKLQECEDALEGETLKRTELESANKELTADIRTQKAEYLKLEKTTKEYEKATGKAQKEAKDAKGRADRLISTQKDQLKNAERRYEEAARDLKQWRDKYGWSVGAPADEKHALQVKISEWQSKAEQARNEIVSLEEQIQGTPEHIGLHQALEQWEEHQGCSAGFADLEDKVHDGMLRQQKLESDLTASKQRYHTAKLDINKLQTKVDQLQQVNKAMEIQIKPNDHFQHDQQLESDLKASQEQLRKTEENMKALQDKVDQSRATGENHVDVIEKTRLAKEMLEEDLRAFQDRHQTALADMWVLQGKVDQLEKAKKVYQDYDKVRTEMLQKLESEQQTRREQYQEMESHMTALQGGADQLKSALRMTREQHQTTQSNLEKLQDTADKLDSALRVEKEQHGTTRTNMGAVQGKADQLEMELKNTTDAHQESKSDMKALQEKVDQLESDLQNSEEQHQTTKSSMKALQEKADQLDLALRTEKQEHETTKTDMGPFQGKACQLESDLRTSIEKFQTSKSDMDVLQGKVDQLESDLKTAEEQYQTTKSSMEALQERADQLEQENKIFQDLEIQRLQTEASEKKEQDEKENSEVADAMPQDVAGQVVLIKTQQPQDENPTEAEQAQQVSPPSSPTYTTDSSSQDLEKTPRPKISLRQELGYSSQEHSDEEVFDEEHDASAESSENYDSEDAGEPSDGSKRRWKRKLFRKEQKVNNVDTLETRAKERAKEQSEILENLFECTPAKAGAIDRRLKALGPGCLLYEAPAVVAYELSGILEDTYKGLASGQLIAIMPPNEAKDVGTDPDIFAADVATDTTDLPAAEIGTDIATDTADLPIEGPLFIARDRATDTADLPVQGVPAFDKDTTYWDLVLCLLVSIIAFSGLFGFYAGLKPDPKPTTPHGILHKHVFSHRHTAFPTPSLNASTPITLLYQPTPALHFGLPTMMKGASLDRGVKRNRW